MLCGQCGRSHRDGIKKGDTIERSRERKKEKSPSSPPRPYDTRKGKDGLFVLAG